jgi:hypothetical protein
MNVEGPAVFFGGFTAVPTDFVPGPDLVLDLLPSWSVTEDAPSAPTWIVWPGAVRTIVIGRGAAPTTKLATSNAKVREKNRYSAFGTRKWRARNVVARPSPTELAAPIDLSVTKRFSAIPAFHSTGISLRTGTDST